MNPLQIIEAARPEVGPMPAAERRYLRERIFDVAMRAQTEHRSVDVASSNTRFANALRLTALGLLGAVAIGGLAYSASRETPGSRATAPDTSDADAPVTSEPPSNTIAPTPLPTVTTSTTMPLIAGSADTPLLLPPERNRLDDLTVTRASLGGSSLLLQAPDLSTISLVEADGVEPPAVAAPEPESDAESDPDAPPPTTIPPPRQFAAIRVNPPGIDTPGQYRLEVPCGSVTVLDAAGRAEFRPEITQLFDSMRIVDGVIEMTLPDGWAAISSGPSTDEFVFGLPVDIADRSVTIGVAQYPGGSLAVAGANQSQYGPTTFNGQPAWLHRDTEDPAAFDIISTVGSTAIRLSASDISLAEAEAVINGLNPGDVEEWTNRFGTLPVEVDPDIRTCVAQPEFKIT